MQPSMGFDSNAMMTLLLLHARVVQLLQPAALCNYVMLLLHIHGLHV